MRVKSMPQRMYSHAEFFHSLEECMKNSPFRPIPKPWRKSAAG